MNNLSPLEAIFFAALEKGTDEERTAYLDEVCAGDPDLHRRVEKMLAAQVQAGSFLEQPVPTIDITNDESSYLALGTIIGPYKLLEQIGEGGMGVVFMAEQKQPVQRKVALKVIKPGMDSRQVIARFEAERQALAMMDHVNIARVIDGGTTASGRPYFVMELIPGIPITKYCDDKHLTPRERLELFIPVCQAIQHAHQKGIIHRDIKPSNVLVTMYDDKPVPKVIDFGVAKAIDQKMTNNTFFTNMGTLVGTLEYMSPEQAEMNNLGVDTRSDIYSLGVLLYELLTGSTPLPRKRLKEAANLEILRMIKEEEPQKPSTRLSESGEALASISAMRKTEPAKLSKLMKGELDWIVMKTLEKDRNRRYETANGLSVEVQCYLADEPVQACPPSKTYRLLKFVRRNRVPVLVTLTLTLLLLAGITGTSFSLWRAVAAEQLASDRLSDVTREKDNAQTAAAETKAVLDFFLTKVLASARPEGKEGGLGRAVTIRQAMDAAEPSVAAAFRDRPIVEANIRYALGLTYWYLGEADLAVRQAERVHEILLGKFGPDHPDTLQSSNNLASAYQDACRFELAYPLFEHTLAATRLKLGSDHPNTLTCINNLGMAYLEAGKFKQAMPLLQEALTTRIKLDPNDEHTLTSMSNLAMVYTEIHRLDLALPLLEQAVALQTRKFGPTHIDTLSSTQNLAMAYQDAGKLDLALPLLVQALAFAKDKLGPDNLLTLTSMNNLAMVYEEKRQYDLALPLFEAAVEGAKKKMSLAHPHRQNYIHNLSELHIVLGTPAKSEMLLRELAEYQKRVNGVNSLQYASGMAFLGHNLLEQKKYIDAETTLREALRIREHNQPDNWLTFNTKSLLGGCLLAQKKYAEAEPWLLAGYEGIKKRANELLPVNKNRLVRALERLVQLYDAWDKKDEAAKWRIKLEKQKKDSNVKNQETANKPK